MAADGQQWEEPYLGNSPRYQFGVVNIGRFNSMQRMQQVLAVAGENGWDLVHVYDKASNWTNGELGFMLFRRPVQPGVRLPADQWCIALEHITGGVA